MFYHLQVLAQYLSPKYFLSRVFGYLANKKLSHMTSLFIRWFSKRYRVDLSAAVISDIADFKTFNDFFTRKLKPSLRPIAVGNDIIVHPADGTLSCFGKIVDGTLFQAKGKTYSLKALLGGNELDSSALEAGCYATTYLAPGDYHRVHMPYDGKLDKMIFVPGQFFSVSPQMAQSIDNLFAKNERAVCFFHNDKIGKFAVVLVGAAIVSGISTVFEGPVNSGHMKKIKVYDYSSRHIFLKKGEELGCFSLGSTVISLFSQSMRFNTDLLLNKKVTFGSPLGHRE